MMNGENNRNGKLQTIATALSVVLSVGAITKTVFFAGGNQGAVEQHLISDDRRLDYDDQRFDRDEARLDTQIQLMRDSLDRQKEALDQQRRLNDYLESQLSQSGRRR